MSQQTVYDEATLVVMARNLRIRIDQKARTIFVPQRNSRRFGKLVLITEFPEPKKQVVADGLRACGWYVQSEIGTKK